MISPSVQREDFRQSFTDLLSRLGPRLKRLVASFRIPAAEAEDLLQDACLSLVRHWPRIEYPEAWLWQTLYRMCCAHARRRRRQWIQYLDSRLLEALAPAQRPAQEQAERLLDLIALAALLPRRYQLLLRLRYGLGMSTEEIAAQLGYRSSSVRKLSARALARIRQLQTRA